MLMLSYLLHYVNKNDRTRSVGRFIFVGLIICFDKSKQVPGQITQLIWIRVMRRTIFIVYHQVNICNTSMIIKLLIVNIDKKAMLC